MESILTSVKKNIGITEEYEHFDADLVMHINSVFAFLTQMGIGPNIGFTITDKSSNWSDFLEESLALSLVQTYMSKKVKLLFDPPLTSSVMEATNRQIDELEWRLSIEASKTGDAEIQNGGDS